MRKIILCRGIQASGKSTFAKEWVLESPEHRVRFNNDDIRNMLGKYWVTSREVLVNAIKKQFLTTAMKKGYDIIIDNMNLNKKEINFYKSYVDAHNSTIEDIRLEEKLKPEQDFHYTIEYKDFRTPLEECIERDSKRENPIGKEVITNTYNKYKEFYG